MTLTVTEAGLALTDPATYADEDAVSYQSSKDKRGKRSPGVPDDERR
jgi:hypothetical protein